MMIQDLQQQWAKLEGAGPQQMKLDSQAFAQALNEGLGRFFAELEAQTGVTVNEAHWQRGQDGPAR